MKMADNDDDRYAAVLQLVNKDMHEKMVQKKEILPAKFFYEKLARNSEWAPKLQEALELISKRSDLDARISFYNEFKDKVFNLRVEEDGYIPLNLTSLGDEGMDFFIKSIQEAFDEANIKLMGGVTINKNHIIWEKLKDVTQGRMKLYVSKDEWDAEKAQGKFFRCFHIFFTEELRNAGVVKKIQDADIKRRTQHNLKYTRRLALLSNPEEGRYCPRCRSRAHFSSDCPRTNFPYSQRGFHRSRGAHRGTRRQRPYPRGRSNYGFQ